MNGSLLIQFNEINSLGVPIIDDQHRGIASVINSLAFFIERDKGEFFLNTAYSMMDSYTKLHFSTEELLLQAAGYPELDAHKRLHAHLIRQSFFTVSESLRLSDPGIYLRFLKEWWVGHINQCDRAYAAFLAEYFARQPIDEAHR